MSTYIVSARVKTPRAGLRDNAQLSFASLKDHRYCEVEARKLGAVASHPVLPREAKSLICIATWRPVAMDWFIAGCSAWQHLFVC
jgi:hypothetical protein